MTLYLMISLLFAPQCYCPGSAFTVPEIQAAAKTNGSDGMKVTATNDVMPMSPGPRCQPPRVKVDFTVNRETALLKLAEGYQVWSLVLWGGGPLVKEMTRSPKPLEYTLDYRTIEVH